MTASTDEEASAEVPPQDYEWFVEQIKARPAGMTPHEWVTSLPDFPAVWYAWATRYVRDQGKERNDDR